MSEIPINPREDAAAYQIALERRIQAAYNNMHDIEDFVAGAMHDEWLIYTLRQQLEAQGFELAAVKEQLADAQRLHAMMTADMMIEFMKSSAQQECVELRQLLAAVTAGGDALAAENARLRTALESIQVNTNKARELNWSEAVNFLDVIHDVSNRALGDTGEAK